jgi:hypothetical protein
MTAPGLNQSPVARLNGDEADLPNSGRNEGPPEQHPPINAGGEQRQMQPDRVLIGMKHQLESRPGETLEPTPAGGRKTINLSYSLGMEPAAEPRTRVVKGDRCKRTNRRRVGFFPGLPEGLIVGPLVKKDSQLANMMGDPIRQQNIP